MTPDVRLNDLLLQPHTNPSALYRYRDGIAGVDLLAAAVVHLDVLTPLVDAPSSLSEICARHAIHPRPADVMMTLLASLGLVECRDGRFHPTLLAREHLVRGARWNLSPYYGSLKDRSHTLDMVRVLREGKPANWGGYDPQAWAQAMERADFATSFTAAMDSRGVLLGEALARTVDLSGRSALLDVAGGSGIYACALAARNPNLRAAVLEKPPVDRIAREAIARRGGADRLEVRAGDMFTSDWPADFDVHLISNVLHDWDEPDVRRLLARSHAALPPGGLLLVHDAYINEEKNGPVEVAEYSALLMNITEGKCYSTGEMREYVADAGFEFLEYRDTALHRGVVLAEKS